MEDRIIESRTTDDRITLDYGSGGLKTSELIESILLPAFDNDTLASLGDGAVLDGSQKLVFSTDSFVVSPWKFPGGDIGRLSVCGTVNDLCMAGGIPKYLSLSFILEEGFPFSDFKSIVSSIADQYEPEALVGKKIVVLVNLRPHKFGNEYSNGMLLASGNSDGTCRVLFAADDAEIGSLVH